MKTGFIELDELITLDEGKLLILASRPGMGKSTLALNIATNIAVKEKFPILYFNLESSKDEILTKIISAKSMVAKDKLKNAKLEDDDWEKLKEGMRKLQESEIFIDDTPAISIDEICRISRKLRKEKDIKFIVIDYIQLISYNKQELLSREQEVSRISLKLKCLTRELDIPILVLSQLSREVEKREDHRPRLYDLKKSEDLEQEADVVLLLYRDEYYNKDTEHKCIAEVSIAKNRDGKFGVAKLLTLFEYCKFANLETEEIKAKL